MQILYGIFKAISFAGLCAGIRTRFGIRKTSAPYAAVSCIITLLTIGGILGILQPMVYALYALGFAGAIYAYGIRRSAPDRRLLLAGGVFIAFLLWYYGKTHLWMNDDISHWGLVDRTLLRYDRFPGGNDAYVRFQSYPLGMACFTYYVCHMITMAESGFFIAYALLAGTLLLAVMSVCVNRKRCAITHSLWLFGSVFLFICFRWMSCLQVDAMVAFFGIGIAGAIAGERKEPRKALLLAIPGCVAATMVKNDGAFFAVTGAAALYIIYRRAGYSKKCAAMAMLAAAGSALAIFALWSIYIRGAYANALASKHAVSLSAYIAELREKGLPLMLRILKNVAKRYLKPSFISLTSMLLAAGMSAILYVYTKGTSIGKTVFRYAMMIAGVYVIWSLLVTIMYLVSMPEKEALEVASFYRYNGSGIDYVIGLLLILTCVVIDRTDRSLRPARLIFGAAAAGVTAAYLIVCFAGLSFTRSWSVAEKLERRTLQPDPLAWMEDIKAVNDLPDGGRYMLLLSDGDLQDTWYSYENYTLLYIAKYEFETMDICGAVYDDEKDEYVITAQLENDGSTKDIDSYIRENIDSCDAVLVLGSDDRFKPVLDGIESEVPVFYLSSYIG